MKLVIIISLFLISPDSRAQWPGAFYAFEFTDTGGKNIDSLSRDYKIYPDTIAPGLSSVEICTDNKTRRFYKGDKNLYVANFLIVEKISDGKFTETMLIKFPPPMTGGKEKYYSNLYVGELKFSPGTYKIKFPETADE